MRAPSFSFEGALFFLGRPLFFSGRQIIFFSGALLFSVLGRPLFRALGRPKKGVKFTVIILCAFEDGSVSERLLQNDVGAVRGSWVTVHGAIHTCDVCGLGLVFGVPAILLLHEHWGVVWMELAVGEEGANVPEDEFFFFQTKEFNSVRKKNRT